MVLAVVVVLLGQLVIGWIRGIWNDLQYGFHVSSDDHLHQFSPRREAVIL
jgi:hypothetical protein